MRCIFAIRLFLGGEGTGWFRRCREVSRSFGRRSVVQTSLIYPSAKCFGKVDKWV